MVTADANRTVSSQGGRETDIPAQGCPGDGDLCHSGGSQSRCQSFPVMTATRRGMGWMLSWGS